LEICEFVYASCDKPSGKSSIFPLWHKAFLKGTLASVENVGKLCGYKIPSCFINVFKEETGMIPKQYREGSEKAL